MSGIIRAFDSAFRRKEEQRWEKIYVLVDIHDTIFKACYENEETYEAYPWALTTLRLMTQHKDICLILWTSTYPEKLDEYLKKLITLENENDNKLYYHCFLLLIYNFRLYLDLKEGRNHKK